MSNRVGELRSVRNDTFLNWLRFGQPDSVEGDPNLLLLTLLC